MSCILLLLVQKIYRNKSAFRKKFGDSIWWLAITEVTADKSYWLNLEKWAFVSRQCGYFRRAALFYSALLKWADIVPRVWPTLGTGTRKETKSISHCLMRQTPPLKNCSENWIRTYNRCSCDSPHPFFSRCNLLWYRMHQQKPRGTY